MFILVTERNKYLIHCVEQSIGAFFAEGMVDVTVARNDVEQLGAHGQLVADGHVLLPGLANQGEPVTVCCSKVRPTTTCQSGTGISHGNVKRGYKFIKASSVWLQVDLGCRGQRQTQLGQGVLVHGVEARVDFERLKTSLTNETDVVLLAVAHVAVHGPSVDS